MLFVPPSMPFMVPEAEAGHTGSHTIVGPNDWVSASSGICWPNQSDCRGVIFPENGVLVIEVHNENSGNPADLYKAEIFIDKGDCQNNYYAPDNCSSADPNEIFSRWNLPMRDGGVSCVSGMTMWGNEGDGSEGLEGPTNSVCDGTITVTRSGVGVYQYKIDTSNLADGEHKIQGGTIYSATGSGSWSVTILVGSAETQAPDVEDPVITVPEVTLDQWGNKVIELTMSGLTNFPTASWSVSATDNVGVTNGPVCYITDNYNSDSPNPVWNSSTQSYDFTGVTNPSGTQFPIGSTQIHCAASDAAGNNGWYGFNVKVTHDDPIGLVQIMDKPGSFILTQSRIYNGPGGYQEFNQLKPIADLITQSNAAGMYQRDAEWTLLGGEIEFNDFGAPPDVPNSGSFYTLMKRCSENSCFEYQPPKSLATMLTDSNMAGMWERNLPDRTWTVGVNTITVSEQSNSLLTGVQVCYSPSDGGTTCLGGSTFKPFADMINESTMNEAMYNRANMRLLDAGGPAAPAPESSSTPPVVTVPADITVTPSNLISFPLVGSIDTFYNSTGTCSPDIYDLNYQTCPEYGAIGWDGSGVSFSSDAKTNTSNCTGNFHPIGLPSGDPFPRTFPIGTTIVTCSVSNDAGNVGTGSFTVTVTYPDVWDTAPPVVTVPADITVTASNLISFPLVGSIDTFYNSAGTCSPDIYDLNYQTCPEDGAIGWDGSGVSFSDDDGIDFKTCTGNFQSQGMPDGEPIPRMFGYGTTTVTCTATDDAGNVGTGSFTVTVILEGAADTAAEAAAAEAAADAAAAAAAAAASLAASDAAAAAAASLAASDAAWVEANPGMVKNAAGSSTPGCEDTNSCFIPSIIAISTGDTVTWVNLDTAAHTVTSGTTLGGPSGVWDSSLMMAGGTSFSHTFDTAGTYPYLCMVHPWMLGTVIVTGAAVEEEIIIPSWIKSNAGWWDAGLIDDRNYVTGLQWLITNGIMTIPSTEQGTGSDDVIPSWVKNNARWWADGSIDDRNYVTGLQWLITNGVMTIG